MRFCRATHTRFEQPRFGVIEGSAVRVFEADVSVDALPTSPTSYTVPLEEVKLVAPVTPSKIVCVGRNYREHAAELGNKMPDEPLLFLKAPSSIIGDGHTIELPSQSDRVEHEGELGVVMNHHVHRIGQDEDPLSYVLGYTCVNDVTARDLQRKDVQFTRAKSFDTFCPVGPVIVSDINPLDTEVTTRLNGQIKQQARTSTMAFSVPFLIRYIAEIMTLYPGDLIATGTPAGVSPMRHGDVVEVEIEGIGVLRNRVG
jgi:2-keto-4-pentenoate hydratase/2-oxohepta-3-ene-1,7-dioic acid hydratase in catechol pathway